ncbi:putative P450 monooxygenase, partial [Zymoseptoria tritici IPO323]
TESVFATRNHQDHQFLRKRVFKTYSMSSILSMEHLIDEVVDLSLRQLHCHVMDNRPVRLDRWTMFFAYEVVSNLALGHLKGFLERGEDVNNIIDSNHTGFWLNANVGYLPGQSRWFSNYYFLWVMTKLGSNFSAISDWIDGAVANGRRGHSSISRGPDLLQHFLNMSDGGGKPVSDEEVASEIGNVLGAGADTTGILIMATIKYLIENQSDYCRLQREVDAEHRRLQLSAGQEIRYTDLAKLPFLFAVVQESLRLHPSIVYQLPRESLKSGTTIRDQLIPPGVSISVSAAAVNRSVDVFGSDADAWTPQRWMEQNAGGGGDSSFTLESSLMTFGRGSRGCIGKNLALVEAYKYTASFVRNFDASFIDPKKNGTVISYWFAKIEGVDVALTSRLA